jgi:hypothetical protein
MTDLSKLYIGTAADSLRSVLVPSSVIAIVLSFGFATASRHDSSPDLAGPLFAANATLVALILPTAALTKDYINRLMDFLGSALELNLVPEDKREEEANAIEASAKDVV